tara:strand:- start:22 stop:249 length:228 start_codon:yes stop_codon:yes gene_type:complete
MREAKTNSKAKDWKPATSFTVKKLKPNGPKEGQSLSSYMQGRAKGDAEWRTMSTKYNETGKKQTRTVRKPRWTIK